MNPRHIARVPRAVRRVEQRIQGKKLTEGVYTRRQRKMLARAVRATRRWYQG